ncbi:MAG: threonine-phosphate decarboxylase CobD [Candidatus Omnitrophota bacterium]|nr:threonine-phosphate decarboxylase CobD [Candidatus Omnitrophota bacterium]
MTHGNHGGDCLRSNILDFSVNINPMGLPGRVASIISKSTDAVLSYPDPSSERLKNRLALLNNVKPENVVIGNGSIELIHLIPRAIKIKRAIIPVPTFSEYELALKANNSKIVFLNTDERDNFKVDPAKIADALKQCCALFLCNPNNPTGSLLNADEVLRIAYLCKKRKTTLILDEAFIEFTKEAAASGIVKEAVKSGYLIVLRSLTKFFAMPGLRLGYAVAHKNIIKKIAGFQYPWNVNILAQLAGKEAIKDRAYMKKTPVFISEERRYMSEALNNIKGLKAYPSSANFILCKLQDASIRDCGGLKRRLLRDGIYIRDCGNFRGLNGRFFRVAVRRRMDNNRLISSIKKAIR